MALRILGYVPQRQIFPLMASSISLSVGLEFSASKTAALIICPDWQYPHCGTSSSIQAFCSGCVKSSESPSMVVTCLPAARESGATHERIAWPSRCTVQAPHSAIPQPNFVPVIASESRNTHRRGVEGSTSTCTDFPFRKKLVIDSLLLTATEIWCPYPEVRWNYSAEGYFLRAPFFVPEENLLRIEHRPFYFFGRRRVQILSLPAHRRGDARSPARV